MAQKVCVMGSLLSVMILHVDCYKILSESIKKSVSVNACMCWGEDTYSRVRVWPSVDHGIYDRQTEDNLCHILPFHLV